MSKDDAWVGTWRPHKPRRPIAAQYGSPGPKYALPGLTGNTNHDPTKYKAPMFSFGARHTHNSESPPGPSYLIPSNITRVGQVGGPAFSFGSRPREPQLFQTPGPGFYSPEHSGKSVFRSAPAYSLSGRPKDLRIINTPGPASYSLPPVLGHKTVTTSAAPAFSICGRSKTGSFHEDLKTTPGPAAYKVVDPCIYSQRSPQFSMTGRNFPPGDTTKTPGPGAYYPERVTLTRPKAPSFSFGLRHSEYISPLIIDVPE
ncbi:outer dense fiber protein 3-B-like [Etheostoma cragini]|uniref:outer dense fiber protein 3-B-like n=1 Tax=Etheostoma cragini TaxID=417921 RepID=UPI00155E6A2D|nr:outer dense fiber protein 3-B-like [Etheostoma cragini]XP_034735162.1 outer dense fiber protein 3-B-like [Etheostoma cragini]